MIPILRRATSEAVFEGLGGVTPQQHRPVIELDAHDPDVVGSVREQIDAPWSDKRII